jgi:ATP-dependent Clp endopeptidase proteolytic subunit ClpP
MKEINKYLLQLRGSSVPKNHGIPIVSAKKNAKTVDVYLNDVIGGDYITALDLVDAIPPDVETINLKINSPGGEVFEGLAIHDFLSQHPAHINVRVTGLAASMASIIAMTGDEITLPVGRRIMIHKPWTWMVGNADDLEKEAEILNSIGDDMALIYSERTGNDVDQVQKWMKDVTYFGSDDAVQYGFADLVSEADEVETSTRFNLAAFDPQLKIDGSGLQPALEDVLAGILEGIQIKIDSSARETNRVAMAQTSSTTHKTETGDEENMNEKLRKMLEAKGLATDATEDQAWDFLAKIDQPPSVDLEKVKTDAIKAEQDRQKDIRKMCQVARLDEAFTEKLVSEGATVDAARQMIFAEMERVNPPMGAVRIETGQTDTEKFHDAARDGLLLRAGIQIDKPAPGANEFRGHEMASIIRLSMKRAGADVSQLNSRRAVADAVFNRRFGAHTTSDFPYIFRDAANKTLLKAYTEAPATWKPWVNIVSASDFKTIYGIALSEAPNVDIVQEAEEYSYGKLLENQETYRVYKYGKILRLTLEMIINDDLRAFTRYPQLMGAAARRKESDLVYALLTSGSNSHGPTMTDTYQLFKATNHLNLLQTGRTISASNIDAAIQKMTAQTGLNGSTLDIQPRYLIVSPKNRLSARILFESAAYTEATYNAGVINPMQNELQVIVENRLGAVFSGLGWYLVADPGQIDTFEVAYLEGYETPQITEHEEYKNDSIDWKIRQFFGVGAMEYRSMVLNDGTA